MGGMRSSSRPADDREDQMTRPLAALCELLLAELGPGSRVGGGARALRDREPR